MDRTHSSIFFMSVSSSQGFISSVTEDFAITAGSVELRESERKKKKKDITDVHHSNEESENTRCYKIGYVAWNWKWKNRVPVPAGFVIYTYKYLGKVWIYIPQSYSLIRKICISKVLSEKKKKKIFTAQKYFLALCKGLMSYKRQINHFKVLIGSFVSEIFFCFETI